jgi:hypothetical protein
VRASSASIPSACGTGCASSHPGPGAAIEASETVAFKGVVGAAKDLLTIRRPIDAIRRQQSLLLVASGAVAAVSDRCRELDQRAENMEKNYDTARMSAALRYPALGAILDDAGREALEATEGVAAARTAATFADEVETLGKPGLGKRLLDRLSALRKQPVSVRLLGEAGEAQMKAVARATEAISKEAGEATRIASIAGHDIKLTKSGLLVICTECTWLRERFAAELGANPKLMARMTAAQGKAARNALDATSRAEVEALTKELQQTREAQLVVVTVG